jgi:hypothetical protein
MGGEGRGDESGDLEYLRGELGRYLERRREAGADDAARRCVFLSCVAAAGGGSHESFRSLVLTLLDGKLALRRISDPKPVRIFGCPPFLF